MGLPAPLGISGSALPPAGDQANEVLSGTFSAVGPSPQIPLRGLMNLAVWASYTTALTTANGSLNASVAAAGNIAVGDNVNSVNVPLGTTWKTFAAGNGTLALPTLTLQGRADFPGQIIKDLMFTTGLVGAAVAGPGIQAGTTVDAIVQAAVPASNVNGIVSPATEGIVHLSLPTTSQPIYKGKSPFTFALGPQAITTGVDANASFTGKEIVYTASVQLERSFDGGATPLICNIGSNGALAYWTTGTPVNIAFGEPEKSVYYRLNCTAYTNVAGVTLNYRLSTTGAAAESLAVNQLS